MESLGASILTITLDLISVLLILQSLDYYKYTDPNK